MRRSGRLKSALRKKTVWALAAAAFLGGAATHLTVGCDGWEPGDPFSHYSPEVEKALAMMDAGEYKSAEEILGDYLETGVCKGKSIGLPEALQALKQTPDGSFDLGLTLFYLGEKYGRKFGDEEKTDGTEDDQDDIDRRSSEIDCAKLILEAFAHDNTIQDELRARAYYLLGNLEFLRRKYLDAIKFYDQALQLIPGIVEEAGGDGIGRDTAWNRAIALRRLENEKPDGGADGADGDDGADGADGDDGADGADGADADADGPPDAPDGDADGNDGPDGADGADGSPDGDAGDGGPGDSGDAGEDSGDGGDGGLDGGDGGDGGDGRDSGVDGGAPRLEPPDGDQDSEPDQSQEDLEDDQLLDDAEQTPTYQQELAKRRNGGRRTMEDK